MDQRMKEIKVVRIRDKKIPLTYTGVKREGSSSVAYELFSSETKEKYYLKISESGEEQLLLPKINQIFQNEVFSEPDASKRMNYMPVPDALTDSPDDFNEEFMRTVDLAQYRIQLQTAGAGVSCEKQLPESTHARIQIAIELAKLLRACAKNKIAYVDMKPLEHLFWEMKEQMQITLIDWGNARMNASGDLLLDDIRKFCVFFPELIYGKSMLNLANQGKFEYPIQKENQKTLNRLMGKISFHLNNAPLNQKYALLIGDLIAGNISDARIQNRCADVWDDILRALYEAEEETARETNNIATWETLKKDAEASISKETDAFLTRDFRKNLDPRLISLASYKCWLLPALRAVQLWYGRIDLIPQQGFDHCCELAISDQTGALIPAYQKLSDLVYSRLARVSDHLELIQILQDHLTQIGNVIKAWDFIRKVETGEATLELFQTSFADTNMRVIDPLLADAYRKFSRKLDEKAPIMQEPAIVDVPVSAPSMRNNAPAAVSDPTALPKKAQQVLDVFANAHNFSDLRNVNFFADLNDLLVNQSADNFMLESELRPVFNAMFQEVEKWMMKVGASKYVVMDEDLNSLDWVSYLPSAVADSKVFRKNNPIQVSAFIRECLVNLQAELARAASASIELNPQMQVRDLLPRVKALRKKLDAENLSQFRGLIEKGDFVLAKQIIDDHYLEFPALYERMRAEIGLQQKEGDDQRSLALINSLLNDLFSNSNSLETGKFIKNQNNIPYVSQKIASYRQKNTQLFDIQDELIRTKVLANDAKKATSSMKSMGWMNVALLFAVILLSVVMMVLMLAKNFRLEKSMSQMEQNLVAFQQTNEVYAKTSMELSVQLMNQPTPEPPTPMPTAAPTATIQIVIDVPDANSTNPMPDVDLNSADAHLQALVGADVVFNLDGGVALFGDPDMTEARKIGSVINYAQNMNGRLLGYSEKVVNLEIPFNIGMERISASTMSNVSQETNIRQYSNPPGETQVIFITKSAITLTKQASDCSPAPKSFCHGTISIWIQRALVEASIK